MPSVDQVLAKQLIKIRNAESNSVVDHVKRSVVANISGFGMQVPAMGMGVCAAA
jgi:hypothetical protein